MDFRLSEVGVDEVGVLGAACAARREFLKSSSTDQKKDGRNGNHDQKNQLSSSNTFFSILLHISPLLLSFLFLPTVLKRFF